MRPLLVVGEAPSRLSLEPLGGRCGSLLEDLLGPGAWAAADRVNLLGEWPGREGRGSAFPLALARASASALAERFGRYRVVLLLGARVARAASLCPRELEWCMVRGACVGRLPHPSGVNRWWNSEENRAAARAFAREASYLALG